MVHVDTSALTRALYTSDGSLYRVEPRCVAMPHSREELIAVVNWALAEGIPITARGAGTSCAGNAIGTGLIIDLRQLNQIHAIDPDRQLAVVDPGVVQDQLQTAARPYGLRLGPDPSTSSRCTVGGMIGNNACGPRALGYGRMSDNLVELEIIDGKGELHVLGRGSGIPELQTLVASNLGLIRTEFGRFTRQVSGYSLEHLLPERGYNLAQFFAGTEGTLGIITRATVRLVAEPTHRVMVVLGYPSMAAAGDDIADLLSFSPSACEGLDRRIVDVVNEKQGVLPALPDGEGWMFIELAGEEYEEVQHRAEQLLSMAQKIDGWVVSDPAQASALWQIRADGAGLAGLSLAKPAYPGWEDSAVPPQHLGDYLRAFDECLTKYGLHGLPYGHFGDGCVHCRIDFPLDEEDGPARYRAFVEEAAQLCSSFGGSLSGEHGDGRARSALLGHMYSDAALALFGQVKEIFDPKNLLNPGILVAPLPVEADTRAAAVTTSPFTLSDPEFVREVHRCSGVGKCLTADGSAGLMCPSFQATKQEKNSTRGRARILQEMINGSIIAKGWRSREVQEALELCLSCKGCVRDCPTGIDIASYKARVTYERLKGRLRPRNHYALGWLPRWGRIITAVPGLSLAINFLGRTPGLRAAMKFIAGVDQRRQLPEFASKKARYRIPPLSLHQTKSKGRVLLWVDSFNDCFTNAAFAATVRLLAWLGYQPELLKKKACCGLTWISTGQLDGARTQLRSAARALTPYLAQNIPIIGLEPSCTAVWRGDAQDLLPQDNKVAALRGKILTLAEFLQADEDFVAPDLSDHEIIAQPHCHHSSVIGWQADQEILRSTGASLTIVTGCCGLAGNFGVERGHYEVSVKVFDKLGQAINSHPGAIVLADGFSCRTQLRQLSDAQPMSLAELLLAHIAMP